MRSYWRASLGLAALIVLVAAPGSAQSDRVEFFETNGATDEFGFKAVENRVGIHDLHATILHCLGIDHRRLSVKFQGLDVRLTGVENHEPVRAILA